MRSHCSILAAILAVAACQAGQTGAGNVSEERTPEPPTRVQKPSQADGGLDDERSVAEPFGIADANRECEPAAENGAKGAIANGEKDGPLLQRIRVVDTELTGTWQGFTLIGFDYCTLVIEKDAAREGTFQLQFIQRSDAGNHAEKRTATYKDGVLTFNKKIERFVSTEKPYQVLYTVRAKGVDFLLPDENAKKLTDIDQLRPGFAYRHPPQTDEEHFAERAKKQAPPEDDSQRKARISGGRFMTADHTAWGLVLGFDSDPVETRKTLDARLREKISVVDRFCQLTGMQKQDLRLQGERDIKRFFELVDKIRKKFHQIKGEPDRVPELVKEAQPLTRMIRQGLSRDNSNFIESIEKILTPAQRDRYEPLQVVLRAGGQVTASDDNFYHVVWLSVVLTGTAFTDDGMSRVGALANAGIISLHLERTQVSDAGLAHLKSLAELDDLRLDGTLVTDAGLAHLKNLKQLRYLSLADTRLTDDGIEPLKRLVELHRLSLDNTRVTDAGLAHLSNLTNLHELSLNKTQVTGPGLDHLKRLEKLEELSLSNTPLTDEGLKYRRGTANLRSLSLDKTQVTDAGLTRLKGLIKLKQLFLSDTQITGTGLVHLKGLTRLERITLNNTPLSDAGLEHLKGLSRLDELELVKTRVTRAGVRDLLRVLPILNVQWSPADENADPDDM